MVARERMDFPALGLAFMVDSAFRPWLSYCSRIRQAVKALLSRARRSCLCTRHRHGMLESAHSGGVRLASRLALAGGSAAAGFAGQGRRWREVMRNGDGRLVSASDRGV